MILRGCKDGESNAMGSLEHSDQSRVTSSGKVWYGASKYYLLTDIGVRLKSKMLSRVEKEEVLASFVRMFWDLAKFGGTNVAEEIASFFGVAGKDVDGCSINKGEL